jgi:hypothetical protein
MKRYTAHCVVLRDEGDMITSISFSSDEKHKVIDRMQGYLISVSYFRGFKTGDSVTVLNISDNVIHDTVNYTEKEFNKL